MIPKMCQECFNGNRNVSPFDGMLHREKTIQSTSDEREMIFMIFMIGPQNFVTQMSFSLMSLSSDDDVLIGENSEAIAVRNIMN